MRDDETEQRTHAAEEGSRQGSARRERPGERLSATHNMLHGIDKAFWSWDFALLSTL